MRFEFEDEDLQRLYSDPRYRIPKYGPIVTKRFRMRVGIIADASDERDLRAMKSLHYEKLRGDRLGQRSIAIDKQWRLVGTVLTRNDEKVFNIIEITDYH